MTSFVTISDMSQVAPVTPVLYKGAKYTNIYKRLGKAQITFGSISIILAISAIGIAVTNSLNTAPLIVPGILCGILVVIAGILGVKSGRKPTRCLVAAAMIMTIFAAIASGVMFSFEVILVMSSLSTPSSYQLPMTIIHIILAIIAFNQLVIAIAHLAYCCAAKCCKSTPPEKMSSRSTVNTITTTTSSPGQMPETAIPEQEGHNVQVIIQSQPLMKLQDIHQPVQQAMLQNQFISTATQQTNSESDSECVKSVSYPPQPDLDCPVYEELHSLQVAPVTPVPFKREKDENKLESSRRGENAITTTTPSNQMPETAIPEQEGHNVQDIIQSETGVKLQDIQQPVQQVTLQDQFIISATQQTAKQNISERLEQISYPTTESKSEYVEPVPNPMTTIDGSYIDFDNPQPDLDCPVYEELLSLQVAPVTPVPYKREKDAIELESSPNAMNATTRTATNTSDQMPETAIPEQEGHNMQDIIQGELEMKLQDIQQPVQQITLQDQFIITATQQTTTESKSEYVEPVSNPTTNLEEEYTEVDYREPDVNPRLYEESLSLQSSPNAMNATTRTATNASDQKQETAIPEQEGHNVQDIIQGEPEVKLQDIHQPVQQVTLQDQFIITATQQTTTESTSKHVEPVPNPMTTIDGAYIDFDNPQPDLDCPVYEEPLSLQVAPVTLVPCKREKDENKLESSPNAMNATTRTATNASDQMLETAIPEQEGHNVQDIIQGEPEVKLQDIQQPVQQVTLQDQFIITATQQTTTESTSKYVEPVSNPMTTIDGAYIDFDNLQPDLDCPVYEELLSLQVAPVTPVPFKREKDENKLESSPNAMNATTRTATNTSDQMPETAIPEQEGHNVQDIIQGVPEVKLQDIHQPVQQVTLQGQFIITATQQTTTESTSKYVEPVSNPMTTIDGAYIDFDNPQPDLDCPVYEETLSLQVAPFTPILFKREKDENKLESSPNAMNATTRTATKTSDQMPETAIPEQEGHNVQDIIQGEPEVKLQDIHQPVQQITLQDQFIITATQQTTTESTSKYVEPVPNPMTTIDGAYIDSDNPQPDLDCPVYEELLSLQSSPNAMNATTRTATNASDQMPETAIPEQEGHNMQDIIQGEPGVKLQDIHQPVQQVTLQGQFIITATQQTTTESTSKYMEPVSNPVAPVTPVPYKREKDASKLESSPIGVNATTRTATSASHQMPETAISEQEGLNVQDIIQSKPGVKLQHIHQPVQQVTLQDKFIITATQQTTTESKSEYVEPVSNPTTNLEEEYTELDYREPDVNPHLYEESLSLQSSPNAMNATTRTATNASDQMPETAIPEQEGHNVQDIIQGEPGVKLQDIHQPVQQVTLQDQSIITATQQTTTESKSEYMEPVPNPMTTIDGAYIDFDNPQPNLDCPVYEETLSLQSSPNALNATTRTATRGASHQMPEAAIHEQEGRNVQDIIQSKPGVKLQHIHQPVQQVTLQDKFIITATQQTTTESKSEYVEPVSNPTTNLEEEYTELDYREPDVNPHLYEESLSLQSSPNAMNATTRTATNASDQMPETAIPEQEGHNVQDIIQGEPGVKLQDIQQPVQQVTLQDQSIITATQQTTTESKSEYMEPVPNPMTTIDGAYIDFDNPQPDLDCPVYEETLSLQSSPNALNATTRTATRGASHQMPEAAIHEQEGRNVQDIIQGEPGVKLQHIHQPVQQVTLQDKFIITATQQTTTESNSEYVEPISYQTTNFEEEYTELDYRDPDVSPHRYKSTLYTQVAPVTPVLHRGERFANKLEISQNAVNVTKTTTSASEQMPETAIPDEEGQNVQDIIQGEPEVKLQVFHQPVQQAVLQNQSIVTATQQTKTESNSEYVEPISYPAKTTDVGYMELDNPQPDVNLYEVPISLQNMSR